MIVYNVNKQGWKELDVTNLSNQQISEELSEEFWITLKKKWWQSRATFIRKANQQLFSHKTILK